MDMERKFKLFKALYDILNENYQIQKTDELAKFLSEADPYAYAENVSYDPAVFDEFCDIYDFCIKNKMNDYDLLVYYLEHLDPYYGEIKKYFLLIPKDECVNKLAKLVN